MASARSALCIAATSDSVPYCRKIVSSVLAFLSCDDHAPPYFIPRPISPTRTPATLSAIAAPPAATSGLERQAVSPSTLRPSKGQPFRLTSMSAFLATSPVIGSVTGCPVVFRAGAPADFTASAAAGAVDRADRWNACCATAGAAKRVAAEGRAAAARNERKGVAIESRGMLDCVE